MKILFKLIKLAITLVVVVIAADVALVFGIPRMQPDIGKGDSVIILGAAINTPALYNRTMTGLNLYNEGKTELMILSGGKIAEADISEAQYMEKTIKKNSGPVLPKYILEDNSHNTYENIRFSEQKLGKVESGWGKKGSVIIVSDEFHLARSVVMAYRAGFSPVYWAAPKPDYYSAKDLRYYYFRELVAMISYIPKFIRG